MSWFSTSRILEGGLPLFAQALFEPERITMKLDDMATVGEAVQERRREPWITEDLSPAGEVQVRGYQYRAPLVAVGKQPE